MLGYNGPGQFKNVKTAATTLVKTGEGVLNHIQINGGTLTGTITVYDGVDATGKVIAIIGANQVNGNRYEYNCEVTTGICVVASANVDFTVCFN